MTCGNDSEIKFWVPPTKWIGEDAYQPNLKVQENSGFEIKLKSTGSSNPEKKTKGDKEKKKTSKKNESDYSESDSSSDEKESK